MHPIRSFIRAGTAAAILASGTPAWPQGLDAHTLKSHGGTYMVDCKNPASAKATVFADALVFLNADKRIAGSKVETRASSFGNSPPKDFLFELFSTVPGGLEMSWYVHQDSSGPYLYISADPKLMAIIGKAMAEKKFRRCDGAPTKVATPAPPQRKYALTELSAAGILMDPKAKAAYYKALGSLRREPWLAKLDGPSTENKPVTVAGTDYVLAICCKDHDCHDNNTVLLYSAAQNIVYGKIYQRGKSYLIGTPPPAVARELEQLWRKEWRSNPQ